MASDASLEGYGAVCGQQALRGYWTTLQRQMSHINRLELEAVYIALNTWREPLKDRQIHLYIDNQVAMSYVRKAGGGVP